MVKKIISGGQTGADQGGLAGAKFLGIPTGGTAPLMYRVEDGVNPTLLRDVYGLVEGKSWGWSERTLLNVREADATVWFGTTLYKGGYKTTKDACILLWGRRDLNDHWIENPTPEELRKFCEDYKVEVLNVAGNRESGNRGIHDKVRDTIVAAFSPLQTIREVVEEQGLQTETQNS